MPVSKRSKVVHLSKTKKQKNGHRGRALDAKNLLIETVRELAGEEGAQLYVVEVKNQKNALLKLARDALKPGRLFFGKNKVLQVALGAQPSTECLDNVSKLTKLLKGERGILITKDNLTDVKTRLSEVTSDEFAKAGFPATQTITLEAGFDSLAKFPHSMEPRLRSLGLPTQLQNGRINLLGRHTVCKVGAPLSVEQAQLLKHLDIKMATFSLAVVGHWHNGKVTKFEAS
ncbi:hypothetical protein Efla_000180 [Eimeria flavescens]